MNITEKTIYTGQPEYGTHFWNAMRGDDSRYGNLTHGYDTETGTYDMPNTSYGKYMTALERESLFRRIGTVINAYGSGYRIFAKDYDDIAAWVSENNAIPIYDGMDDFTSLPVDSFKLATLIKFTEEFVHDASFNIEDYLTKRLAKNFGRAESNAFINGNGVDMPTGILHPGDGAEVALVTDNITYDQMFGLYFSLKPEYRENAVWLMNDETALALRGLTDSDGNYLWKDNDNTLIGKKVCISEYMPNADAGEKPIAFGDFGYYWVIGRKPITVRTLREKFATYGQIGYLAFESLDAKLVRREAVQVIQINDLA
jgi:HK97 family phage major capsid protein